MKTTLRFSLFFVLILLSCNDKAKESKETTEAQTEKTPDSSEKVFTELTSEILEDFEKRSIRENRNLVNVLENIMPNFKDHWNYGNAIHKLNIAKGRIAIQENNIEEAKKYLTEAGKTSGSPQLNTFGPNMTLAKELLQEDEKEIVLDYFELCRNFWDDKSDKMGTWKKEIEKDKIPDFGAHLKY